MNIRHSYRVVWKAGTLGFHQVIQDKLILLGSFFTYAIIMLLYSGVINMIPPEDLAPYNLTAAKMIWYLGTTELVLFTCNSWVFKGIQADIFSEQIHLSLLRPFPNIFLRVALWSGEAVARLCVFLPLYLILMSILSGSFTLTLGMALGVLLSLPIGILLLQGFYYGIGTFCLWGGQSEPMFWIFIKLVFLLSPMLWPMAFYPEWAQVIMWLTPFPATLAAAGHWALGADEGVLFFAFLHQIFWAAIAIMFVQRFEGVVLRKIQKGGA